jgi:hypothetical protein
MLDEEVFGLDVFGTFGAGDMAIFFERETAHVVLEDNISGD